MRTNPVIATYADVAIESEDEFRAWHVDVQLPALQAAPGVQQVSLLESMDGQPRFLLLLELEHESMAETAPVRAALSWGPWLRALRGWHRRTYRPIFAMGSPHAVSPYVLTVRTDVEAGTEGVFNDWYNHTHIPEVLDCPGFVAAARYESLEGEPQFLAMYELSRPDALGTPEMDRVYGFGPMTPHVRSEHGRIYARRQNAAQR